MNKVFLLGRLTKDPEVRYTTTGKVVAQFTIAVDRPYTNIDGQKDADFFPIVIWARVRRPPAIPYAKAKEFLLKAVYKSAAMMPKTAPNVGLQK